GSIAFAFMPTIQIANLDDPRLAPYRAIRDREIARNGQRFLAEGEVIVRRLLASDFPVESILASERRAEAIAEAVPGEVPMFVAEHAAVSQIVGIKFHGGILACGRRKPMPQVSQALPKSGPITLLIVPETHSPDNLGSLIRTGAALGADAMLLGERSCDAFWRQTIRVSMGAAFTLPIYRSENLIEDVRFLQQHLGIEMIASVLAPGARPLHGVNRPARLGLLVGNEAHGLERQYIELADHRVTIPMHLGTDSLNVTVAAAIFLHQFRKTNPREARG
ncbi:MAG TPA: RNA methyltransferase, partial [Tepidisphaeraceae bacterium]|nr:RNA methyltransferase [Tepidisphaeraceae bacterium]